MLINLRLAKIFVFILACLAIGACNSSEKTSDANVRTITEDHKLWLIKGSEPRQLIADDGQDYKVTVSADGNLIAIDMTLLSNLHVTRILTHDKKSNTYASPINLSTLAWQQLAQKHDFELDEMINPRTQFNSFLADGRIQLDLICQMEDGEYFEETVTLDPDRYNQ